MEDISEKKFSKMKKEVSALKEDVRLLKMLMLKLRNVEQLNADKSALEALEKSIDE